MSGDPFRAELTTCPAQLRHRPEPEGPPLGGDGLVIIGMGGSALAAEFGAAGLRARPATVRREEHLPGDLRPGDAVICVSCSGNTAETLTVWREAAERGLPRGAVASGGALLDAARREGMPRCAIPAGLSPRSSIGYLARALLALAGEPGSAGFWEAAAAHLEGVGERWSSHALEGDGLESGPAQELAWHLHGRLPAFIAPDRHLAPAARRWAADVAENAKSPALVWELPEAAHNAVMVFAREAPRRIPIVPVLLGSPRAAAAVRRWDALRRLLERGGASVLEVADPHPDPWIEALGIACAGGWVSTLMAEIEGVPAGSLSLMNDLKAILGRGGGAGPA